MWTLGSVSGLLTLNVQTVAIAVCILLLWYYIDRPSNLPPGPFNFPVLGVIPFIREPVWRYFDKLKSKYGALIYMRFGNQQSIILTDLDIIKEVFLKHGSSASGRIRYKYITSVTDSEKGG